MTLPAIHPANADQVAYWNGPGGRRWADRDALQESLFAPVTRALLDRARLSSGERVIDVGCGCGATTLEIAALVGPSGRALGLDVSELMLAQARERAPAGAAVDFLLADATTHPFAPRWANLLFSRFGVMFFADPALAFANLRTGLARGGRLTFACWREAKLNPWQMVALKAACKHVPRLPELGPEDPGPFSFANPERVQGILAKAGFANIVLTPIDLELDIADGGGLAAALAISLQIGSASRALDGQPDDLRAAAAQEIRAALAQHQRGDSVPLGAAIWIVEATNP
jgi:ubiquinone/menaquinone biosynthesis C-methylase UbiE